ncbi:hypothetical protein KIL84_017980, partial [Mauremys mutica]
VFLFLCLLQRELVTTRGEETAGFTECFTVELEGAGAVTRLVVQRNGLKYVMKVGKLEGLYVLQSSCGPGSGRRETKRSIKQVLNGLSQDPQ